MERSLEGKRIGVLLLAADSEPAVKVCNSLHERGADLIAVTLGTDGVRGGIEANKAVPIHNADAGTIDGLVIISDEGGVTNFRDFDRSEEFVTTFIRQGKPVAAMGEGSMILADLGLLEGREVAASVSQKEKLESASAHTNDNSMVTDEGLTTATWTVDPEEFAAKVAEEVREGSHPGQHA